MSYVFPVDIQTAISAHIASGRYIKPDDVLRDALRALGEEDEDLVAVQEAIDEWQSGDEGVPLEEAFEEVRRKVKSQSQE